MEGEDTVLNLTQEAIAVISPELAGRLGFLWTALKAIGIAFLIYVSYLIVRAFFSWRNKQRFKKMEQEVARIGKKVDKILDILGDKEEKKDKGKKDKKKKRKLKKKK